jgi:hypothetical protein
MVGARRLDCFENLEIGSGERLGGGRVAMLLFLQMAPVVVEEYERA